MNIFYNNDTLYVTILEELNEYNIEKLKNKLFKIVSDYNIDNICLKFLGVKKDSYLLNSLIEEYNYKFSGNIIIK